MLDGIIAIVLLQCREPKHVHFLLHATRAGSILNNSIYKNPSNTKKKLRIRFYVIIVQRIHKDKRMNQREEERRAGLEGKKEIKVRRQEETGGAERAP